MPTVIDGITGVNRVTDGSIVAADFAPGAVAGGFSTPINFRNKIINGTFDIWQRATSQTATGYGSVDRWFHNHVGSSRTASRQSFSPGQTDVPGNPTFFHRDVVTSVAGASNFVNLAQRIESVTTNEGQVVTLSFSAKASAALSLSVELEQDFGSGGSSIVNGIGPTKLNLTTSWQRFTVQFTVPSISGKTVGTSSSLNVIFWFDAGSNFNARTNNLGQQSGTFDIAQVQLEEGSVATPFESRPISVERILCLRYFELVDNEWKFDGVIGSASVTYGYMAFFTVSKRTIPTLAVTAQSGTNSGAITSLTAKSSNGVFAVFTWTTDGVVSRNKAFVISADAEL